MWRIASKKSPTAEVLPRRLQQILPFSIVSGVTDNFSVVLRRSHIVTDKRDYGYRYDRRCLLSLHCYAHLLDFGAFVLKGNG